MAVDLKRFAEKGTCNESHSVPEDMNIVIVGHVDHGKSTIIGRLLADTDALPEGKLEQVRERCRRNSRPFEYAFLLDALKDEQDQGITIDAARCFFKSSKRRYIIIDAPGHIEFLKNMVTGAARAEAALLVIDATEGVQENSKRHGTLLSMLGISQISVLINKMDLVGYDQGVFDRVVEEYRTFLHSINVEASSFVPVSGMAGDNIAIRSSSMPWYSGAPLLEVLDDFMNPPLPIDKPLRMPVQGVYRFTNDGDQRRIVAGTVESGRLRVGDTIRFSPSGKQSQVKSIEAFNAPQPPTEAVTGWATGFTLSEQIYITRGEIASRVDEEPPAVASALRVNLFWLGKKPLQIGKVYHLKLGAAKVAARLAEVREVLDASNLTRDSKRERVDRHEVAECVLRLSAPVAFDTVDTNEHTSRFVIVDDYEIAGGGIILEPYQESVVWHQGLVTYEDRCRVLGHEGLVLWFTGLSGSGKSTISAAVERHLNAAGRATYRLDGDNIRHGLSSDLGFSGADRDENIRRIAEVAALFADAGLITLVSFISPTAAMRQFARERVGAARFVEIHVKADIETCAKRDPKGMYQRARRGEIKEFTGVSAPYEAPNSPDLVVETDARSVEVCVADVLELVRAREGA